MGIHKIKYAIRSACGISRFEFYCTAQDSAEAMEKFSEFMRQHPANYRSISGGWEVPECEVPRYLNNNSLESGAAVRVG